jgi:ribosomal protein L21E
MPGGQGLRHRTRDLFQRGFRQKGFIPLTTYLRTYKLGDYVDIKMNPAQQKVTKRADHWPVQLASDTKQQQQQPPSSSGTTCRWAAFKASADAHTLSNSRTLHILLVHMVTREACTCQLCSCVSAFVTALLQGMAFKWYHGKTGVVWNVTKRAVGVEVNKTVSDC